MSPAKKILIFRIGSLGDTLIAVPALHVVRRYFPNARLSMLCDTQKGKNYVRPIDLLDGAGLVDDFSNYVSNSKTKLGRLVHMLFLGVRLRLRGYDAMVYLPPTGRSASQVTRDRRFFSKLAGIKKIYGMDLSITIPEQRSTQPMPTLPSEADLILARLAASGIPVPPPFQGETDLGLSSHDDQAVDQWLSTQPSDGGCSWIAIGPGSKMPAKQWPAERYGAVVSDLIQRFDIWPVVFGGNEDREIGDKLLAQWGRGYNAAGSLALRPSCAALRRCRLYLGNDTGTMHMAAFAGAKCVSIFSSRDFPGLWYPYGQGHTNFRTDIPCEGCMLIECIERKMECIKSIQEPEVFAACAQVLQKTL